MATPKPTMGSVKPVVSFPPKSETLLPISFRDFEALLRSPDARSSNFRMMRISLSVLAMMFYLIKQKRDFRLASCGFHCVFTLGFQSSL